MGDMTRDDYLAQFLAAPDDDFIRVLVSLLREQVADLDPILALINTCNPGETLPNEKTDRVCDLINASTDTMRKIIQAASEYDQQKQDRWKTENK